MTQPLEDIPEYQDVTDQAGKLDGVWYRWLYLVKTRILACIVQTGKIVHRAGVAAPILTTTLLSPSFPGTYRVSAYLQITTPATVNSSATLTIGWTANGVAQTKTFPAVTGNTTTTNDSQVLVLRPDNGLPITYAVAYATTGATPMAFLLDVVLEQMT